MSTQDSKENIKNATEELAFNSICDILKYFSESRRTIILQAVATWSKVSGKHAMEKYS